MDENTIIERLAKAEERSKSNSHRIEEIEETVKEIAAEQKAIYKLATSVEVIAQRVSNIDEKVDGLRTTVDNNAKAWQETEKRLTDKINDVENRPAKETFKNVNAVKVAIITAICTMLATGIGGALISLLQP